MRKAAFVLVGAAGILTGGLAARALAFQDFIDFLGDFGCDVVVRTESGKEKAKGSGENYRLDTNDGSTTFDVYDESGELIYSGTLGPPKANGHKYPADDPLDPNDLMDLANGILFSKFAFAIQSDTFDLKGSWKLSGNFQKVKGAQTITFSGTSAGPEHSGEHVSGKIKLKFKGRQPQ